MTTLPITSTFNFEHALQTERARLVRLCAYFAGDSAAAEDLAQETLVEAWRHSDRLQDPSGYAAWLAAIARNVCLRYLRKKGQEAAQLNVPYLLPHQEHDLTVDLERAELATLLDRALALLPPETRQVLIAKYIDETPLAEIANQLDANAGTVAVRLHRGKLELKRLLENELRADAATFGLLPAAPDEWTETRVWCPGCGEHCLRLKLSPTNGFEFKCERCNPEPNSWFAQSSMFDAVEKIKTAKPLITRFAVWMAHYMGTALEDGTVPCFRCGSPTHVTLALPPHAPKSVQGQHGAFLRCTRCTASSYGTLDGLTLNLPQAREFWRAHPRLRNLPERNITYQGQAAVSETYQAMDNGELFHAVYHGETYHLLAAWTEHDPL